MTLLSLAANVASVAGGPFWPTIPVVDLGPPDASTTAFNVPFFVYNKSIIFSIDNALPKCGINLITDDHVIFRNILTIGQGRVTIAPAEKDTFKCYFPFKFDSGVKQAELKIWLEYRTLPWKTESLHLLGTYRWDSESSPPRWTPGRLIERSEPN